MSSENLPALLKSLNVNESSSSKDIIAKTRKSNRTDKSRKQPADAPSKSPPQCTQSKSLEEKLTRGCSRHNSHVDKARRGLPYSAPPGPKNRESSSTRDFSSTDQSSQPLSFYIVQYQPRSPSISNCDTLFGVFTSLTTAKIYVETSIKAAHSQPGANGSAKYPVRGGKLVVLPKQFHSGKEGSSTEQKLNASQQIRSDIEFITQPQSRARGEVYLALDRRTSGELFCVGAFEQKFEAWEACRKYQTQLAYCSTVRGETTWIDKDGMPHVKGEIDGGGMHHWYVGMFMLDRAIPGKLKLDRYGPTE